MSAMIHEVRITQVFRVEKDIILEVEAPTMAHALELANNHDIEIPSADDDLDQRWSKGDWTLEQEEVEPA